jgi:adenylate kinase
MSWRGFLPGVSSLVLASALLLAQGLPQPLVVVLIGPPASGKSTQADYLKAKYKIPIIAIEELVAKNMGNEAANRDLHRGDPALNELLRAQLEETDISRGFALDGYPATREQADYLGALVRELKLPSPIVIQIHVKDNVAHERSAKRGGPDDSPEVIAERLQEYHREMDMLRSYYPQADIWTIDGTRAPRGVSATIRLLVEERME